MKKVLPKLNRFFIAFLFCNLCLIASALGQATVMTDKPDYQPGDYVIVTGTGWEPGETVALDFEETPSVCPNGHLRYTVADDDGNILYDDFLINTYHLGVSFVLTATGQSSGLTAQTTFTDALFFTATISPTSACAGTVTKPFTLTVNNTTTNVNPTTGSNGRLGSVKVQIPSGFTNIIITSISVANWSSDLTTEPGKILFTADGNGDRINQGQSISFSFTANVPSGPLSNPYVWTTDAWVGDDFTGAQYPAIGSVQNPGTQPSVTVNTLPTVSITGLNSSYCKNAAAVTLTGSPSGGSFTIDGNAATSFNPATLSNGAHSVVYSYTDGNGCSNTVTQSVTVNPLPTVAITGLNAAYCKDATAVILTGTPSGGSFTIDGNPATSFDPAALSNGLHVVVYTYTDGNGCTNTSSQNVTVNALPIVSITGLNAAYCKDATAVTLTGAPSGGSFTIDGNPATSFDPAALSNGLHVVVYTYTDGNGCTNTASQNVTVNALPSVSITGLNAAYCKDATAVTLTGSPSGGSFTIDGNPATSFDPAALSNGLHAVIYTYTDGNGCTNTASQNVTVNALPTVSITGLNAAYCKNDAAVTLSGSPSGGSFTIDGNSATSFDPAALSAGQHVVVYTYTDGNGCTNTASQNVQVNALPVVSITGLNAAYCKDATAVTLAGSPAGGSFTIDGNNATTFNPATLSNGSHTVVYTYTDGNGCTNTASQNVMVNALPVASISPNTPGTTTICSGGSIVLTGSATGGSGSGYEYNWNNAGYSATNTLNLTNAVSSSNNSLVVKDGNGCVSAQVSQLVTVNTVTGGVIAKGAMPGPGCGSLNPGQFSSTSEATGSGTLVYTWEISTDGGTSWVTAPPTDGVPPPNTYNPGSISTSTRYRRVATFTLNGVPCVAYSNELIYIVNPLPTVSAISPGGTTNVCLNGTLQLSNSTPGGVWTSSNDLLATVDNTGLVTGVALGSPVISYTVTDATTGCSRTVNKTVNVLALPVVAVSNACIGGGTITFTQSGGTAGGTWSVSGGGTINSTSGVFTPTTAGCFTVTYSAPPSGSGNVVCSDTKSFVVFPSAPSIVSAGNTCNTAFSLPEVTPVNGFNVEYDINNTGFTTTPVIPTTPGCHLIKARYVLASTCGTNAAGIAGTGNCSSSNTVYSVIFPAAPATPVISNTCNTAITVPALTPVAGFTAQYSFNGVWGTSNVSSTTPGCYAVKTRYVLTANCGTTLANANGSGNCNESGEARAVIFPTAPAAPVVSNTCNTAITVPALPPVAGFTAQYSFNGVWGASNVSSTTPGCYAVKTRYVLTANCGTTLADANGSGNCNESIEERAVIFPAAPATPVISNTCNTAITVPALPVIAGFTAQYSFNGVWGTSNVSSTTPGCYAVKTRYVLTATCGSTLADANGSGNCNESGEASAVIFPTAPSTPVIANTCNNAVTVPALPVVAGFTAQYSFNGVWGTSNVSSTTPGCYAVKTRYVLTATCGSTLADANGSGNCNESGEARAVIFPTAPSTPVIANTCNTAITVPALPVVAGFTAQYSFNGIWGTSNVSSTTPGCYVVKTRYVLTATCGTTLADANGSGNCNESGETSAVIFPAAPSTPVISNTCNTAITVPALTPVAGFTAQYSFNGVWGTSNVSSTTPGCYVVRTRYVLTNACGTTLAGANGTGNCNESGEARAVIFPTAPSTPVISNTCNTAITVPALTPVSGFTAQYSFNGIWGTSNVSSTTPGCYAVKTRYVLTSDCGTTLADANGSGNCNESGEVSAAIFPAAPSTPVISNTCNTAITVPALTPVAGFTAQYSFNGVWGTSNVSSTIPGCYAVKTRYVLTATCGSTLADANGSGNCNESGEARAVIFPTAPATPVISNTCNSAITVPALPVVAGFTAQYSFNGVWGTSNVSSTTPGCYAVKTRYVLTATCGSTLADANGSGNCNESGEARAVIFPTAPATPVISNTCNTAITVPALTPVAGFTAQYSFNGIWGTSNVSSTTPGCYAVRTRYVLTNTCGTTLAGANGTGNCNESGEASAVIFPAAPSTPVISNTCNTAITVPALTPVTGFTAQYSFNGVWGTSNVSSITPGCYAVKTRYVLTATCGATLADATGSGNCNESGEARAVIFPSAPATPVISNTCNTAITVPALPVVAGFTAQYSFNGVWGTSNVSSTTPGCYAVKTRYVLTATCGSTLADAAGSGNCNESGEARAVIFPTAPATPVISNTCNTAITVPALTPVAGFTAQYSFNGVWGTSNVSSTTPGCYAVRTRYVLTNTCGTTLAGANGIGNCNESGETSAVIFPAAPSTVDVNSGVGPIVVTPPATVPGFNIEYSFNDGQSWGPNTPPTADNCTGYKIKTRYVTAAICGNIAAGTASAVAACKESPAVTRIVDNTIPTITCAGNITVNTNSGVCYATVSLTAPTTSDNCGVANVSNNAPSTYPLGETTVTWTVTDVNGLTNTCTQKVYVDKITTIRTVNVQPSSQHYSDKVTFTATVTPYNCAGANAIGGSVKFKIGSLEMGTAPIINGVATLADVPLLEDQLYDADPNNAMNATNGPLKPAEDKIVTAIFINTDPRYIVADVTTTLDVTCEDADVMYNGLTYFTVNPNTKEGLVTLSASVIDKNEGDPATRGDIRNATVTFWEGSLNGTVKGTPNIPVGLVNPDNKQEGIASTDFEDNLSSSEASSGGKVYEIFAGANNYYCGSTDGYTTVTLAMPGQDFVTGGGYINMQNSAGTYAGTNGKRMNFGLVMKWNSSGKNLQGSVNIIYRKVVSGVTRIYQIKSNAINSLAVANVNDNGQVVTGNAITFRRATISTKANLRDITDPLNPISLGGNLAFTIIAWESTTVQTGALDRISVQLVGSGSTGLLFASSWSGGNAVWTQLAGGKIQARNPSVPAPSVITQAPKNEEEVKPEDAKQELAVRVFGNPTETQFILMPESSSAGLISIRVMDIHGRILEKKDNVVSGQVVRFGNNFKIGTYFAELIQGSQRKVVTLVKQ